MSKGIRAGGSAGRLSIDVIAEVARLENDMAKIRRIVKDASADIAKNTKAANDNLANIGSGARLARHHTQNLAFQFQDLGIQMAAAAQSSKPLQGAMMALMQQGSQIAGIMMQAGIGVRGLVGEIGGMIGRFAAAHPILVAVGVAAAVTAGALKLISSSFDDQGGEAYARSLGLTNKEMKKLGDLGVTTGDVLKGLWKTIYDSLELGEVFAKLRGWAGNAFGAIKGWAADAFSTALRWIKNYLSVSYAAFIGTGRALASLGAAAKQAASGDFQGALATIKGIPDGYSQAFGQAQTVVDGFFSRAGKAISNFGDQWQKNTLSARNNRIRDDAVKILDDRTQKKMKDKAKETGSMLGDVMSGAFLANFAAKMQAHPFAKVDWAGPTDLRDQMEEKEEIQRGKQRLKEFEDYMDERARERFRRVANEFSDIVGGRLGTIFSRLSDILDKYFKGVTKILGDMMGGLGSFLKEWLKTAAVGGAAARATGGSALGGMFGGVIGKGLGELAGNAIGGIMKKLGGPLGTIAGGIIGGVVGGLLKKVKKASATVEIIAGEAMQTSLNGNSAKLKKVAGAMADGLIGGLSSIADQLGGLLGGAVKISIGQRNKTFRVDTAGLGRTKNMPKFDTEEEAIQYAIQQAILQGAITGLRAGTEALIKGQGDLQTQLEKAMKFENVFKDLAQRANPTIAAIDGITKEFDDLIDIFEEAGATAEDYGKLQELMAIRQRKALETAFEPIRSLLDDLKGRADTAGEAVRTAYDAVLQREADAVAAYQAALVEQQQKAIDSLKGGMDALRDTATGFADAAKKIRDFTRGIYGDPSIAALRGSFAAVSAKAQGGDMDALAALPDVGAALRSAVEATATDRVSMMREFGRIAAEADKAAASAEGRASAAEQQLATMQKQLDALQAVQDATASAGETAMSIEDLLTEMQTARQAADQARAQMAKLGELTQTETSFADAVAAYEQAKADRDDLIRQITAAGFADLITVQQQTGAQMVAALAQAAAQAQQASANAAAAITAAQVAQAAAAKAANDNLRWQEMLGRMSFFADGGSHRGGLRVVGEEGPELEATGPSRIWNAGQIADALGGGADPDAIGEAVADALRPYLYEIAKQTGKGTEILKRWEGGGLPEERSVA